MQSRARVRISTHDRATLGILDMAFLVSSAAPLGSEGERSYGYKKFGIDTFPIMVSLRRLPVPPAALA